MQHSINKYREWLQSELSFIESEKGMYPRSARIQGRKRAIENCSERFEQIFGPVQPQSEGGLQWVKLSKEFPPFHIGVFVSFSGSPCIGMAYPNQDGETVFSIDGVIIREEEYHKIIWLRESASPSTANTEEGADQLQLAAHEREVLAQAFDKVRKLFQQRSWIMDGRGCYPYNDDRYKEEVRYLYDEFEALANDTWANIKTKSGEYRKWIIDQYLKDPESKEQQIAFAEWISVKRYAPTKTGCWVKRGNDVTVYSSSELYNLFLTETKQQ